MDKIKYIKCHVSRKRQRNMYNFANNIKLKSRHELKMLPRSKPKVLQRKCSIYLIMCISVFRRNCRDMYRGIVL